MRREGARTVGEFRDPAPTLLPSNVPKHANPFRLTRVIVSPSLENKLPWAGGIG